LQRPAGQQHFLAVGETGKQGCGGKNEEAGREDAPGAEQIAESPAQEEQAAEGDYVGIEDPAQAAGAEAQIGLDGRQRHADD
jgi:hypothetical protein